MQKLPSKKEIVDKIKSKISEAINDSSVLQGKKMDKSIEKAAKKIAKKVLKSSKVKKEPALSTNQPEKKAKEKIIKATTL